MTHGDTSAASEATRILDRRAHDEKVAEEVVDQSHIRACEANNQRDVSPPGATTVPDGVLSDGQRTWAITDWRWGTPPQGWTDLTQLAALVDNGLNDAYPSHASNNKACWSPRALELLRSGRASACGHYADGPGSFCSDYRPSSTSTTPLTSAPATTAPPNARALCIADGAYDPGGAGFLATGPTCPPGTHPTGD